MKHLDGASSHGNATIGDGDGSASGDGDAIDRHASAFGRPNVLIELRNDLIADHHLQQAWAARLAPILTRALDLTGL